MADIETSVVVSAQTDDLRSGMEQASNTVELATDAMRAQFAALGAAAEQAQSQIGTAFAQAGSSIGSFQTKIAGLSGATVSGLMPRDSGDAQIGSGQVIGGDGGQGGSTGSGQDRVRAWRAELQAQLIDEQAFFRDLKSEELTFWQDKLALTEAGSKARFAIQNNIYQLEKQLAVQSERDQLAALSADEKVSDAVYARKKAAIEAAAQTGKISANEEIAQLQQLLDEKWALDQDYFEKKLAAAESDSHTREKLLDEERLIYEKFLTDKQRLDTQAVLNSEKAWQSLMQPIQRAFDTAITGMILGTTTLQKAVANIGQSIVAEFVNAGVKMVTNWIAAELGMTAATAAGAAARTSAENEGLAAGLAMKALNAVKSIITDGAQAFAGIFAFLSPILGPAAAGPAAAGQATVLAAAGSVASAAGGWVVPSDQLALVHQNEMILPAALSQGLQGMIAGGGSGTPVVINVSAIDSQDVRRFFQSNGNQLVAAINKAMRNGATLRSA